MKKEFTRREVLGAGLGAAALATALSVTTVGVIGFIGLVVPHLVRLVAGSDHRVVLPASALAGGALLVIADTLARTVMAPRQLPVGALTAATPDGRLAGQTLSDGGSPVQGASRSGATTALRSMAKADYILAPGGAAMNLRLSPAHFEGQAGLDLLADMLKTYFDLGGEQIQVNMVSRETLQKALENPGAYRDLVVRVAGFTAYFVSLSPELQAEVAARA